MRYLTSLSSLLLLASLSMGNAMATPAAPVNGAEYLTLQAAQPVQAPDKKIEVIEFFMYHCPACYALEPSLMAWVKQQGDKIVFRRMHLPHGDPSSDAESHLFLTLEAMKSEAALHDKVLLTFHVERRRLANDEDNIAWAVKNGIDKVTFLNYYNSFSVLTHLRGLGTNAAKYQVDSTPTLIVDGRFLSNPSMVGESNKAVARTDLAAAQFQTMDALLAKARKDRGW